MRERKSDIMYFVLYHFGKSDFPVGNFAVRLQENKEKCVLIDISEFDDFENKEKVMAGADYISRRIRKELSVNRSSFSVIGYQKGGFLAYEAVSVLEKQYRITAKNIYVIAGDSPDLQAGYDIQKNSISSNIISMTGKKDKETTWDSVKNWSSYTRGFFINIAFDGDHHFVNENPKPICTEILKIEKNSKQNSVSSIRSTFRASDKFLKVSDVITPV